MFIKSIRFIAMLSLALGASSAFADNLPSPCGVGEIGSGTNCMYLVVAGNSYDPATGDRELSSAPLTLDIEVWMDFGEIAVQGGGFDITYDTFEVSSVSWLISPGLADDESLMGSEGATGYEGIQFDNFFGSGYGGSTGNQPGFQLVGTLTVTLSGNGPVLFSIAQPYTTATFPNCFAPGAGSGEPLECVATNFFDLLVDPSSGAPDTDNDGVTDDVDNCTLVANPGQADFDADGFGNFCDADFNDDCSTNFIDLTYMKGVFFSNDGEADLNSDGSVNFLDLTLLKGMFFGQPGPSALATCP